MTATSSRPGAWPAARRRLVVAGGVLAGGLGLSALFSRTGVGLVCPFRLLTGWQCPLCGGTRMGAALLHGDLAAAYAANPAALLAVAVLVLLAAASAVQLAGGPVLRVPERVRAVLGRVPRAVWPALGGVLALAYAVVRNLG